MPAEDGMARGASRAFDDTKKLTPLGSAAMDVVRFSAAFAVCYGHFSSPLFSTGWKSRLDLAGYAVAVFFVLSGFMMRLVTTTKKMTAREYCVDRISRMYSVVLPAILLTVIVNVIGLLHRSGHMPPELFARPAALLAASLADLTFTSQWFGFNVNSPVNPVFWSLSYECSYYLLFGLIVFGRGRTNRIAFVGLCILLGPPILLLFPVWLLGCVAHDVYKHLRTYRYAWLGVSLLLATAAAASVLLRGIFRSAMIQLQASGAATSVHAIHEALLRRHWHIFQRASPSFYMVGVPTAVLLVWLLLVADRIHTRVPRRILRGIRTIAEGTFALYLMHLSILVLFADLVPYAKDNLLTKCSMLVLTVCICIALSAPMERLKQKLRKMMHGRQHGLLAEVDGGSLRD